MVLLRRQTWVLISCAIGALFVPAGFLFAVALWEFNFPISPVLIPVAAGCVAGTLAWQGSLAAVVSTTLMLLLFDRHPFPQRWEVVLSNVGIIAGATTLLKLLSVGAHRWLDLPELIERAPRPSTSRIAEAEVE